MGGQQMGGQQMGGNYNPGQYNAQPGQSNAQQWGPNRQQSGNGQTTNLRALSVNSSGGSSSRSTYLPIIIALAAVNGVLVIGGIIALVVYLIKRKRNNVKAKGRPSDAGYDQRMCVLTLVRDPLVDSMC